MILRDIATERKALYMKLKNSPFLNSMAHGIKCTLPPARYRLKENIYVGICIDTACSLGICAERNAIANMITNGENRIRRVIAIDRNGEAIPPCGACREFMTQLMPEDYRSIEIMLDHEKEKVVTLRELTPEWWI